MNNLLSNINGTFEVTVETASILKMTAAIAALIILFFILKTQL